jgi:predicted nucleic acid-binding protein
VIVSDSSPLISLAQIGRLDLLHRLYNELLVPQAVWNEVVLRGVDQPGVDELKAASWIKTEAVSNRELVLALQRDLDPGESEAIVLALEKKAEVLLMDERLGREAAHYFGIRCMGV